MASIVFLPWTVVAIVIEKAVGDCFDNDYARRLLAAGEDDKIFSDAA